MSVKIKINWDNENVVSESVRIYRADSIFTPTSLPPLLTEIFGDIYEYEDLTTVENQTYFYMLSCLLVDQEVFTECFEVLATVYDPEIFVNFTSVNQTLIASLSSSVIRARGFAPIPNSSNYLALVYDTQARLVEVDASGSVLKLMSLGAFDIYTCQFFDSGLTLRIFKNNGSGWGVRKYNLSIAYDISTAVLDTGGLNPLTGSSIFYIFATPKIFYATYSTTNRIEMFELLNDYDFSVILNKTTISGIEGLPLSGVTGLIFSETGLTALALSGSFESSKQEITTMSLSTAFDLRSASTVKSYSIYKSALGLASIYLKNGVITGVPIRSELYAGSYMRDLVKINLI